MNANLSKLLMLGVGLSLTVACSSGGQLEYSSSVYTETRGVAFDDEGSAQVGMYGNTCQIDASSGMIGADLDVAENEDTVVDAVNGDVLVLGTDGLHLYDPSAGWGANTDPVAPGTDVVAGRFTDSGLVVVRQTGAGLDVAWQGDGAGVTLAGFGGDAKFDVDPVGGTAFFANGEVVAADADGADTVAQGDLIAWDGTADVLYVADLQGSELRGVEADGSLRFVTELDGRISSIDALGARGAAVVSMATADGGALVTVDGLTGEILATQVTPSAATEVVASEGGGTLAVRVVDQIGSELHFFRVHGF